jgi:hypothetical protein
MSNNGKRPVREYVVSELYNLPQIPISEFRIADDIVLKQVNEETCFFINHNKGSISPGEHEDDFAEKALTYCQLISLVSEFVPKVEIVSTIRIDDPNSLGSNVHKRVVRSSLKIPWIAGSVEKAKEEYKLFLESTKRLFDKYGRLNNLLPFLKISSECCYRAQTNQDLVESSFVDATICLEALLNENPDKLDTSFR